MANPPAIPITLSEADRGLLQGWVRCRETAQALATRARIVLACAEPGGTNGAVAAALGVSRTTVALWRRRFAARGGRPAGRAQAGRAAPDQRRAG